MEAILEFQGEYRFLSNFHEEPVFFGGITFRNAEAAFHASKFADPKIRMSFKNLNASESKRLGHSTPGMRSDWSTVRVSIMSQIVHAKFTSNKTLQTKLLQTLDAPLIEGNTWGDKFWGVDIKTQQGKNMLGRILMAERAYWQTFDASSSVAKPASE